MKKLIDYLVLTTIIFLLCSIALSVILMTVEKSP